MPLSRTASSVGPMQPAALKVRRNDPYAFDVLSTSVASRTTSFGIGAPSPAPSSSTMGHFAAADDIASTSSRSSGNAGHCYCAACVQEASDVSSCPSVHESSHGLPPTPPPADMLLPPTPAAVPMATLGAPAHPFFRQAQATRPPAVAVSPAVTPSPRGPSTPVGAKSSSSSTPSQRTQAAAQGSHAPAATPRARKVTVTFKFGPRDFRSTFRVNMGDLVVVQWDKNSTHIGTISAIAADDGVMSPAALPELCLMRRARDLDIREFENAQMREPTTVIECQRLIDKLVAAKTVRNTCHVIDAEWQLDRASVTVLLQFAGSEEEMEAIHEALAERLQCSVYMLFQ